MKWTPWKRDHEEAVERARRQYEEAKRARDEAESLHRKAQNMASAMRHERSVNGYAAIIQYALRGKA